MHAVIREVLAVVSLTQPTFRVHSLAVAPARPARRPSYVYLVCQGQVYIAWHAVWAALQLNKVLLAKASTILWLYGRGIIYTIVLNFV